MSEIVSVALGGRGYDIHIGSGLLASAGRLLTPFARGAVPVVMDENVARLHLSRLLSSLRKHEIRAHPIVLPAGERTKSFAWLEKLCRDLIATGVERGGLVVAFGGGVIGDLAGFAAGIVKRGIGIAQIPTTLLAQIDSAVGGKTAIDAPEGKNLIGMFHQPKIVVVDPDLLATLPRRQLLSGYAEAVKYGALGDTGFFGWLEANGAAALAGDGSALERLIAQSCRMKAEIVARDECETGERALLNLGHTFAHALETATGYSDRLLHGEAVAVGMVLAFRLSEELGICPPGDTARLAAHLKSASLPTAVGDIPGPRCEAASLLDIMRYDKKTEGGRLKFVLARGLGQAFVCADVPAAAVAAALE